jgi:hypothetical protein
MQYLLLTYYQRITLWHLVGNSHAPNLKETEKYLRIISKLRLNDAEMAETQYVEDAGKCSWQLPSQDYGTCAIDLENEEARTLATAIETASPVRVNDASWMLDVIAKLKEPAKEQSVA